MELLIGFIGLVFAFHVLSRLRKIEAELTLLKGHAPQPAAAASPRTPVEDVSVPSEPPHLGAPQPVSFMAPGPVTESNFETWLKQDFFVKLGAFLLLLAVGWFVSYAFANNWIGPAGRITLGLVVGVLTMALGVWRIRSFPQQGGIFLVVGSTTVLATLFAARMLYDFFTPTIALGLMFAVAAFIGVVSLTYQRESLAIAGLVLGLLAPLLINAPEPDVAGLFFYLLIVTLGAIAVVSQTGWSSLTPLALTIVGAYSAPYLGWNVDDEVQTTAFLFSFVFAMLFFVTNMVSTVRRIGYKNLQAQVYTALGTAIFLVVWIESAAVAEWKSLLYVAWALVFGMGAYLVAVFTENTKVFYLYGGAAIALIGIATAAELSGPVLVIAFLLQITGLLIAALLMGARAALLARLSWLMAIPLLLSTESFVSTNWRDGVLHSDFVVLLMSIVALCIVGTILSERKQGVPRRGVTTMQVAFSVAGFYTFILVWLIANALLTPDVASMVALTVYTFCGITAFVYGRLNEVRVARVVGTLLIAAVLMRLMFIEVWQMEIAGRIITFFVIGVMLMSTAFIRQTKSVPPPVSPQQ